MVARQPVKLVCLAGICHLLRLRMGGYVFRMKVICMETHATNRCQSRRIEAISGFGLLLDIPKQGVDI